MSNSTLMVMGQLGNRCTRMLIDTGSPVSLVREDVWKEASSPSGDCLSPPAQQIVTANGREMDLLGQGKLPLQIGDLRGQLSVLIAKELTQECLLGADFLQQHNCVINMKERTVTPEEMRPVVCQGKGSSSSKNSVCHVSFTADVVVPGNCQMHLQVSLSQQKHCAGVLEPAAKLMEQQGLLVARSICSMETGNSIVRVLNPSPAPVAVYSNQRVGTIQPLDEPSVCVLQQSESCSKRDHKVEEAVQQMMAQVEDLSTSERESLHSLLCEFGEVISQGDGDLGRTDVVKHRIDTGNAAPIRQPIRRLPVHQRNESQRLVQEMLSRNIIEPAQGPWSSPVVLVKKKDGATRFCVDFRKVNQVTKKDAQPLPRIDDTLDALGSAQWFSTLDLASGYWQVEVDPADKEKTAFATQQGLFQFKVMPFGLCNAPGTFQRLMERVLAGLNWASCLVYLDDIIIFSKDVPEHLKRLREVFERLKGAGLKVKPTKCFLMRRCVHYLGHIVSAKGVETDPGKIRCIQEWPVPKNVKELRQFLGIASYYRRFVKSFAQKASPLYRLTEKGRKWSWTIECGEAFAKLKQALVSPPILAFPDFNCDFVVDTDASTEGLGAILSQQTVDGERVISYTSRTLTKAERQYCATRKEMLALVWGMRQFRPYLYGRAFKARTDHNSLKWLHNFREPEGQVARWLELLSEYNFQVIHRPGLQHRNADALSRSPCKQCGQGEEIVADLAEQAPVADVASMQFCSIPHLSTEEICTMQQESPDLKLFSQWLHSNSIPPKLLAGSTYLKTLWHQRDCITSREGILYRRWKDIPGNGAQPRLQLVLPPHMVSKVLQGLHSSPTGGHLGVAKTLGKARARFYWPGQKRDVEDWCSRCEMCSSRKMPVPKPCAPLQPQMTKLPMERVAMDILGPLPETARGNKYILVIGDYFTKWKEAHAMPNMEAATIARIFVNEFVCRFGIPKQLHTDQGRNFESSLIKEICKILGIVKTRTTPYHPQSDGMIERFNRTVLNMLSTVVSEDEKDWDLHLPTLMLAYRTSPHETTGATPFSLVYGREAALPVDILFNLPTEDGTTVHDFTAVLKERIQQAYKRVQNHSAAVQQKQKVYYDQHAKSTNFETGSLVWLHCPAVRRGKSPKFHQPWKGPFQVVKKLGDVIYRIQHMKNLRKRLVVHSNRLKKHTGDNDHRDDWIVWHELEQSKSKLSENKTTETAGEEHDSTSANQNENVGDSLDLQEDFEVEEQSSTLQQSPDTPPLRRSTRVSRPPVRYGTVVTFRDSDLEIED